MTKRNVRPNRFHGALIFILSVMVAIGAITTAASAQQTPNSVVTAQELPSAPGEGDPPQTGDRQTELSRPSASITGTVLDPNGAAVHDARVSLSGEKGVTDQTATDDQGRFAFSNLPAGNFRITVTAAGFANFTSDPEGLAAGQRLGLPAIALHITGSSSDVRVVATQVEIAQAQVQAQEKQRVLGVVPNFYTSYIWNAAPMTTKQKSPRLISHNPKGVYRSSRKTSNARPHPASDRSPD